MVISSPVPVSLKTASRSYADSPDVDGTVYFEGDCVPDDFAEVKITGLMDGELVGEQI